LAGNEVFEFLEEVADDVMGVDVLVAKLGV
jgi:hypothetical protein